MTKKMMAFQQAKTESLDYVVIIDKVINHQSVQNALDSRNKKPQRPWRIYNTRECWLIEVTKKMMAFQQARCFGVPTSWPYISTVDYT
ncbi:hypothetical protein [Alkaliphilus hydrothermalis]|uniref:Uncharacterized protein n=1 Tax=Alkaliphilus hydrothermalis TaxID=1482730 RepID=A0ABS2NNX0_9FIRM|nr:hypothetical protein [Alkaliphilus hydrothermalis]MBM7614522.1 hypothetical protein [Alkaliphilus hydrothermalis]